MLSLSSSRITTDWPWLVGMTLTRRSSSFSPTVTLIRPSWGRRRSAMSSFDQNFDAREIGTQQTARGAVTFNQDAVNPVADADPVLKRLDVDIRGSELHGFLDHQLDQADHGGTVLIDALRGDASDPPFR